jgi:FdhD protein
MGNDTTEVAITRLNGEGRYAMQDPVVREYSLTIFLNHQEVISLLCSPTKLEYLTLGFLLSAGLIEDREDVKDLRVDEQIGMAQVETGMARNFSNKWMLGSSGGRTSNLIREPTKSEADIRISASTIFSVVESFLVKSSSFKNTGALHSAALFDETGIKIFREDIGRHNAIDKILGECFWEEISTSKAPMITSGRISSEIVLKVARRKVPILISKSAPTDQGVRLANDLGITLVGFVRGNRMNIYAHEWRILA